MPPALWEAAVSLARTHGIYAIARALRVSYETLKRRVEQPPGGGSLGRQEAPDFVEIPVAQLVPSSEATGTVVELTAPDGARLVVRLPVLRPGDFVLAFHAPLCYSLFPWTRSWHIAVDG